MASPVFVRGGRNLVARGSDLRGQLLRYNAKSARFEPRLGGLSGGFLALMAVGLVRWSPDGKRLAFVGKPPDSLPRIYVMPSEGGAPEGVSPPEKGQVWDPCWMPDNKTEVWAASTEEASVRSTRTRGRSPSCPRPPTWTNRSAHARGFFWR